MISNKQFSMRSWSNELRGGSEAAGRYRHEMAFYNGLLLIFGGGTMTDAFPFEKVFVILQFLHG